MNESRRLAEDLADTLRVSRERFLVWTELHLPSKVLGYGGAADVYGIKPSWGVRDVRIYEVKVSRSDYFRGVNEGQHERYMPFCKRFFFATPAGLVKRSEVPDGCGLIVKGTNGWHTVAPAIPREMPDPDFDFLVHLLDQRIDQGREQRRLRDRVIGAEKQAEIPYVVNLGREIAEKVARAENPALLADSALAARGALEFLERAKELAEAAGIEGEWGDNLGSSDLTRLAEFTIALMAEADKVRRVGQFLKMLPFERSRGEIEDVLA